MAEEVLVKGGIRHMVETPVLCTLHDAAPDLLKAAKEAYAKLHNGVLRNLVEQLRSAIDKAEGRS